MLMFVCCLVFMMFMLFGRLGCLFVVCNFKLMLFDVVLLILQHTIGANCNNA